MGRTWCPRALHMRHRLLLTRTKYNQTGRLSDGMCGVSLIEGRACTLLLELCHRTA